MADKLSSMTESKWDSLKKAADIPNTSLFKKLTSGAADVGKAIAKYQSARAAWHDFRGLVSVQKYVLALADLEKAFDKFVAIKEFKSEEARELRAAITEWKAAIDTKQKKLVALISDPATKVALAQNDLEFLLGVFKPKDD